MKVFNNMKMYTSYLESLYKHIFANTPIYSWGYFYYDLNGRCLQLMSDNSLLDVLCIPERNDHQFRRHLIADSGNT